MAKYQESEQQRMTRENNLTHHTPIGDQGERYDEIRRLAREYSRQLNELCPPSRELSIAQTRLEDVVFYANAAIARNES